MLSSHLRRRINQIISVILCVTILAQSSPLPVWPYLRSRPAAAVSAAGARPAQAAAKQAGVAPQALPTPSPATPLTARSTPQPGSSQGGPIALQAAFRFPPLPQGLPRPSSDLRLDNPGLLQANLQSPISNLPLLPGWNLVSIPEQPADTDPAVVLNSIAGNYNLVYAYDGCDAADPWKLYDPAAPPASDLTAIDHKIGLWIEMTAAATLNVAGTKPTSTSIPLCVGWNLIGYPLDKALPVADALASIAGKYTRVLAYDPTDADDPWEIYNVDRPAWANELQVMDRGRGYWVLATEDVTLTIAEPTPSPTPTATPSPTPSPTPTRVPVGQPPTAVITSPDEGAEVTDFVDIVGTADDPDGDLAEYRLQYRQVGLSGTALRAQQKLKAMGLLQEDAEWTTFATGNAPVVNDVLGTLDPTLMLNGMFEIRVLATDSEGQRTTDSVHLVLAGNQKVGIFTISFTDLDIPVAGLPIRVIRTYDSRDKRVGDFGVGWTMHLTNVELSESGVAGEGWEQTKQPGFFPTYCLQPTQLHMVAVTFPTGEVLRFAPRVTPQCQSLIPIQYATVDFVALPGTNSRLEPLGGNDVIVLGTAGEVQLLDLDLNLYDPDAFRLIIEDGTTFVLHQRDGLQQISDSNGNTLFFSPNGIQHSTGKSIAFERDGLGRITRIIDPSGHVLQYAYDARGDLVSFTDAGDNTTTFTYNNNHYLLDIRNPLGQIPVRNEYDENGRLIAHTDGNGNRIEFTHDTDGRQEVVQDRLGNLSVYQYDDQGNVVAITNALGNSQQFTYDDRGNQTSETNPLGNTTTRTYDTRDNLLSETDPLGNTTTFTNDAQGNLLRATDPLGSAASYTYDAAGNELTSTDPLGNTTTTTYDGAGNVTSVTDPLGCVTRFEYDAFGNVTTAIDPLGNVTTYTYDANGNQLTETRTRTTPSGTETLIARLVYDSRGLPVEVMLPDGSRTQTEYDALGREIASIDALGNRTEKEYDALGQLARIIYPDGTTESFTYDAEGRQLSATDRAGRTARFEYDALGRLTRNIYPDGSSTTTTYDAADRVATITDELGNTTSYGYDALGRQREITNALGFVVTSSYDANGALTSSTNALGITTGFAYDANGHQTQVIFPDGTRSTIAYDAVGREIAETDQAGNTTRYTYDCLGQLVKVTNALGGESTYAYDEVRNLISQTDTKGRTTRFEYDRRARMVKRMLPLGQFETMAYDAAGNLISKTDFNGNTTTYEYDVNNRLAKTTYPDGSTITYTYTPTGQRASVTDSRGMTRYEYDARDRLVRVTYPDGRVISYTYDAAGNRTSVTTPAGTTTYTYDALNRLETVTDPDGGVTTYTYDAVGNRASVTYPNGTVTDYTYDSLNRLTRLVNRKADGTVISSYTYTLGPAGNRTKVVEATGRTVEYTYDALYRLTQEKITEPDGSTTTIRYTYDAVGNRLTKTVDGVTTTYTYDANDRLLSEGDTTYTYDANGNLLSKTSPTERVTYEYDFENRLIRATTTRGTVTDVVEYVYDTDGNRVQKVENGTNITNYLVDINQPFTQVLVETDGTGATLARYVYGDDLISMKRGGSVSYYHYDGQMSTRQLTDAAGNVTDSYTYDAFGVLLQRVGTTVNNYLYTGEEFDANIGFYYLRARYYVAVLGRFLTMDAFPGSIHDPPSLHKYVYVANNPVDKVDPSGQVSLGTVIMVAIGVIFVILSLINFIREPSWENAAWLVADIAFLAGGALLRLGRWAGQAMFRSLRGLSKVRGLGASKFLKGLTQKRWVRYVSDSIKALKGREQKVAKLLMREQRGILATDKFLHKNIFRFFRGKKPVDFISAVSGSNKLILTEVKSGLGAGRIAGSIGKFADTIELLRKGHKGLKIGRLEIIYRSLGKLKAGGASYRIVGGVLYENGAPKLVHGLKVFVRLVP